MVQYLKKREQKEMYQNIVIDAIKFKIIIIPLVHLLTAEIFLLCTLLYVMHGQALLLTEEKNKKGKYFQTIYFIKNKIQTCMTNIKNTNFIQILSIIRCRCINTDYVHV